MLVLNTVTQGLKLVGQDCFLFIFSRGTLKEGHVEASFLLAAYINDYLRAMGR